MILGHIPLPKLRIPKRIRAASRSREIDTSQYDVPMGATSWIACREAWPHVDLDWAGQLFISLSIVASHEIGDDYLPRNQYGEVYRLVRPGTLCVIDPETLHWLAPLYTRRPIIQPWIGLQWEVTKANGKDAARRIMAEHGGTWTECDDPRYADWKP